MIIATLVAAVALEAIAIWFQRHPHVIHITHDEFEGWRWWIEKL